ncbi:MAG: hypothetical protein ACR2KL_09105 [Nocardioidaceae bacterium]
MSAWLAWLHATPSRHLDLVATAGATTLAGWRGAHQRPHPDARRIDPRVLDAAGEPCWVSLVWPAEGAMPLYDDPAVLHARRLALTGVPARAFSTLVVDSTHFAGSIWVVDEAAALNDDPFRRVGKPRRLRVGPGLLGAAPRPPGPAIERYAGVPWPADGTG